MSDKADENEELGRLGDETIEAIRGRKLFSLFVPKSLGGLDLTPLEAFSIFERMAKADGAAGWVIAVTNVVIGITAAFLPQAGVDSIFSSRAPIIAGQGAPRGKAVREGNGYRLSGRWSYGSGLLNANFIHTGAIVYENDQPKGPLTLIVPVEKACFLGNWDVIGLRATGSIDYLIDDVYVAQEFTHSPNAMIPLRGGSMFRLGIVGLTPLAHAAFPIGLARRLLDELRFMSVGARSERVDGAQQGFQEHFGAAEGKLRAARAFVVEAFAAARETLAAGGELTTRHITLIRLALIHATTAAHEVCEFAYRISGGAALRNGVLQRGYRDMLAAGQHRIVSSIMMRECSRDLLDQANDKRWTSAGTRERFISGGACIAEHGEAWRPGRTFMQSLIAQMGYILLRPRISKLLPQTSPISSVCEFWTINSTFKQFSILRSRPRA